MKRTLNIAYHTCRIVLGIVFLVSGMLKAIDPLGTVYKIEDYLKAFGGMMTVLMPLAGIAATALILTECVLAATLLSNTLRKASAAVTLLFYAVMTPLTLWIATTNPVSDCGCFGDAIVLTNWQTLGKNVVLLILAIGLLIMTWHKSEDKQQEADGMRRWAWLAGIVIPAMLMWYTLANLPLVDFRPYKVGADLIQLLEIPEDAPVDEYTTTLIYADNEGNEQEFSLENYPKNDSNWIFVDQRSVLTKKGYESPIHDFIILDRDNEDITYDLLESDEPVTLCILYDLNRADAGAQQKVADLARETENLYILTGSGEDDIRRFGLPETAEVCFCDPVTLKTIVRANPGVVILQHGKVVRKYHL